MLKNLKSILLGKKANDGILSYIKFKSAIKAYGMETYKNITILYLSKPSEKDPNKEQLIYHVLHNKKLYHGEAETIEELEKLAKSDIDDNFKNQQ